MKKKAVSDDNLKELTCYENILKEINKLEEIIIEKGLVISKLERYDIFHSLLGNKRLSGDDIIINKIKEIIDLPILQKPYIMHKDSRARSKTIRQTRSQTGRRTRSRTRTPTRTRTRTRTKTKTRTRTRIRTRIRMTTRTRTRTGLV